ncbi:hypothetical protein BVC80_1653g7 [Macleaya cordata]|uniref:Uncharacterized protein n=1 Tax=Macleaya cordata TaxID=56857 RepID=A0A200PSR3_MACCD|nr:hypothetical protein BVC80_1653g7 [Macleaya cordata]
MAKRCDRSSVNAEVHRLKNRVRQQRYRARKREEKAKRDGETLLPSCLFITGSANVTNGLDEIPSNPESIGAINAIRTTAVEHGDASKNHEVCGCIETESSQVRPAVRWQHEQPCNIELVATDAEGDAIISSEPCQAFDTNKIQPLSQMENECSMNTLNTQDGYAMKPLDQREANRSHEEILARRVKNRERQRRYRARKRLEADMKKAYHVNQSITPFLLEAQIQTGFIDKCVNRVPCHRDWKKDARRVHISKEPEVSQTEPQLRSLNSSNHESPNTFPSENKEKQLSVYELKSEHQLSFNAEANGATHGRRDWKMAARNKVD